MRIKLSTLSTHLPTFARKQNVAHTPTLSTEDRLREMNAMLTAQLNETRVETQSFNTLAMNLITK